MRLVITIFLALLLWGYASFLSEDANFSKWVAAVSLLIMGIILQLIYARLVNKHFNTIGMPETVRVRLRDDRGVVPFWIAATGIFARSFAIAGTILPLLEATGFIFRGPA